MTKSKFEVFLPSLIRSITQRNHYCHALFYKWIVDAYTQCHFIHEEVSICAIVLIINKIHNGVVSKRDSRNIIFGDFYLNRNDNKFRKMYWNYLSMFGAKPTIKSLIRCLSEEKERLKKRGMHIPVLKITHFLNVVRLWVFVCRIQTSHPIERSWKHLLATINLQGSVYCTVMKKRLRSNEAMVAMFHQQKRHCGSQDENRKCKTQADFEARVMWSECCYWIAVLQNVDWNVTK